MQNKSLWNIFTDLLYKNRAFQLGLLLKLILSLFFASHFISDLFAPFVKDAINSDFFHVYERYSSTKASAFPYPPLMLYILAFPMWVASFFTGSDINATHLADLFFLRIPLIIADVALLVILIKWLKKKSLLVAWYWFNPIIIYVSYVHGQLDIIPICLLCFSLYFLFQNKFTLFWAFLALACTAKFNMIITVPLLLLFIYKTKKIAPLAAAKGFALFCLVIIAINFPFFLQEGYIKMVYENEEQNKVFNSFFILFDNYKILFIPAAYLMILFLMYYGFRLLNKDLLIIFMALSFGAFTFFIVPRQGWYLWNIPFFIYFLVRFGFRHKALFLGMNLAYFLFFIVSPVSDFPEVAQFILPVKNYTNLYQWLQAHNLNADIVLQVSFTILQTVLFLFCFSIFREGIWQIKKYKAFYQPYLIGICGDSGTGKSMLSESISNVLGSKNTLLVHGDDMHRWERGHQNWNQFTHLNPMANWLHKDISQLMDLKSGKNIIRSMYDHNTGHFTEPINTQPNRIIIYEGLHTFYLKGTDKIYDLKIFMKPDENLRRYWKVERDVKKRGTSTEKVLEVIEKRKEDSITHILNQENEADIIFSIEPTENETGNRAETNNDLMLKIKCRNDIFFEDLLERLRKVETISVKHFIDKSRQEITIGGSISADDINNVAGNLSFELEDVFENKPNWQQNFSGVMQLFIIHYLLSDFIKSGQLYNYEY